MEKIRKQQRSCHLPNVLINTMVQTRAPEPQRGRVGPQISYKVRDPSGLSASGEAARTRVGLLQGPAAAQPGSLVETQILEPRSSCLVGPSNLRFRESSGDHGACPGLRRTGLELVCPQKSLGSSATVSAVWEGHPVSQEQTGSFQVKRTTILHLT